MFTASIFLTTNITKLITTSTCHVIAPFTFFNVVLALRALSELTLFCKFKHLIINFQMHVVDCLCCISSDFYRFGFFENSFKPISLSNLHVHFLVQPFVLFTGIAFMILFTALQTPSLLAYFAIKFFLRSFWVWCIEYKHVVALRVWAFLNIWVFVANPFPFKPCKFF